MIVTATIRVFADEQLITVPRVAWPGVLPCPPSRLEFGRTGVGVCAGGLVTTGGCRGRSAVRPFLRRSHDCGVGCTSSCTHASVLVCSPRGARVRHCAPITAVRELVYGEDGSDVSLFHVERLVAPRTVLV